MSAQRSRWVAVGLILAAAGLAFTATTIVSAAEGREKDPPKLDKEVQSVIDELAKTHQERPAVKALKKKSIEAPSKGLVAKIYEIRPCDVTVTGDPVEIEVFSEVGVGADEPKPRLFIQYIVVRNKQTGAYVLKEADSILLNPGSGICFVPTKQAYHLVPGRYQIVVQIRSANADGSETIQATKVCEFLKAAATEAEKQRPPAPPPQPLATDQPMQTAVALGYVHYVGENRVWLLADGAWREYQTTDSAIKQLVQDGFAASHGFTVTVWYADKKAYHVQMAIYPPPTASAK